MHIDSNQQVTSHSTIKGSDSVKISTLNLNHTHIKMDQHEPIINLNRWIRILQLVVFCLTIFTSFGILIHNFFAPNERDIPQETIVKLVKFIPSVGAVEEWANGTHPFGTN